ncbi:hypothetical protein C2845_PM10G19430 [Panicum miliaceum]|uniref:F-box domain-containing protein n=1 Tax=Panicum miliaceum TaxID=4540 RepID=A0A3L6PC78_PANMI|nr:hypothetical protein C2845_PM10G19430 [Panicum miliaceum]
MTSAGGGRRGGQRRRRRRARQADGDGERREKIVGVGKKPEEDGHGSTKGWGAPAKAQQPDGGGVVPNLNLPPPQDGVPALPLVAAADRISSLPQKARLRILSFLPFKAALALEMVSRRWFALVNKLQRSLDSVLGIHIHSATGRCGCALGIHMHSVNIVPSLTDELDRRGRGPGHRLLRFILEVEGPDDFAFLLDYAADCDVEDVLLVDARPGPPALSYNFERTSRRLVRLTLHGVRVGGIRRGRSYGMLEVVRIESTNLNNLGLTYSSRAPASASSSCAAAAASPASTSRCPEVADISAHAVLGLRSFRYSGDRPKSVALPRSCFGDLYIALRRVRLGTGPLYNWLDALPNLSNLTVLTICSNALRIVSFLSAMTDLQPKCAKLSNLQNLRELQLLIYEMKTLNLSDIYRFLRTCRCPRLKKLFVEVTTFRKDSFMDAVSELPEEPPMDGFRNLVMAKITNFMWQCNEIELVHFLFRKASSLQKLILVAPQGTHPERDQTGNPLFPEANLLHIAKAPVNAQVVMLSEPFRGEIWAFHRNVIFEY